MAQSWSQHVGEWYNKNKGSKGVSNLGDAMRSSACKAEWSSKKRSGSNKTRKNRGGKLKEKKAINSRRKKGKSLKKRVGGQLIDVNKNVDGTYRATIADKQIVETPQINSVDKDAIQTSDNNQVVPTKESDNSNTNIDNNAESK